MRPVPCPSLVGTVLAPCLGAPLSQQLIHHALSLPAVVAEQPAGSLELFAERRHAKLTLGSHVKDDTVPGPQPETPAQIGGHLNASTRVHPYDHCHPTRPLVPTSIQQDTPLRRWVIVRDPTGHGRLPTFGAARATRPAPQGGRRRNRTHGRPGVLGGSAVYGSGVARTSPGRRPRSPRPKGPSIEPYGGGRHQQRAHQPRVQEDGRSHANGQRLHDFQRTQD